MDNTNHIQSTDLTHLLLMEVGKRVRQARHALQLTQEQLGARVGVARSTIIELEHGQRKHLNVALLQAVAAATNTTVANLTDGALAGGSEQTGIVSPTLKRVFVDIAALPAAKQEQVGRVLEPLVELVRMNPE